VDYGHQNIWALKYWRKGINTVSLETCTSCRLLLSIRAFHFVLHALLSSTVIKCSDQWSPIFFVSGPRELLYNRSRVGHLMQCKCFGVCYILPNQQQFHKHIIFALLTKCPCGRMKMALRAGFGPRAGSLDTPGLDQLFSLCGCPNYIHAGSGHSFSSP